MKLRERDLEIDFTNAIDAIVFDQMKADQPGYHGIGQMHRVDFVVELEEAILFVEVKDPGNPKAQAEGLAKFHGELQDGTLSDTFAAKFKTILLNRVTFDHKAQSRKRKPSYYVFPDCIPVYINTSRDSDYPEVFVVQCAKGFSSTPYSIRADALNQIIA